MYNIFYQSITWTNRNCSLHLLFALEMNFRLKKQSVKLFSIENFDIDFFPHRFILSRNLRLDPNDCNFSSFVSLQWVLLKNWNIFYHKFKKFKVSSALNFFFQINSARALILVRSCRYFINPNPIVLIFILKHPYAKRT